jgi:hypothetical protein
MTHVNPKCQTVTFCKSEQVKFSMSPAGNAKMSAAAKARWAKVKSAEKKSLFELLWTWLAS